MMKYNTKRSIRIRKFPRLDHEETMSVDSNLFMLDFVSINADLT